MSTACYPWINNIYFAFKLHFIVLQGHSFDVSNLDNKLDFPFARISNKKEKCVLSHQIYVPGSFNLLNMHNLVQRENAHKEIADFRFLNGGRYHLLSKT